MPKISIIIPVYNAQKYLAECLDSALNQTLDDIEIICIDDGSTDSSPEILDSYAAQNPKIIVIHQANAGPGYSRNVGINCANGKYIAFLDSDDVMRKNLCEKTFHIAEECGADMVMFNFSTQSWCQKRTNNKRKTDIISCVVKGDLSVLAGQHIIWNRLWRSDFIKSNGIQFPDLMVGEDTIFNWKALLACPKAQFCNDNLLFHRHVTNYFSNDLSERVISRIIKMYDELKCFLLQSNNYTDKWKDSFIREKINHLAWSFTMGKKTPRLIEMVRETLGNEEKHYLKNHYINLQTKCFYAMILNGNYSLYSLLYHGFYMKTKIKYLILDLINTILSKR
jgi:glycosyltransferase involved in cell wall biosynthesis